MAISKKYFHDHFVLLLLSSNAFLAVAGIIYITISLSTGHSNNYIVQCRDCSDQFKVNKYTTGSAVDLISLAVFAVLVLVTHTTLSLATYKIHRQLAVAVLSLGILLLLITIIISHQLLQLH